jgi:hypothetical protein
VTTFTITTPINGSSLTRLGSVAALAWTRATTTATVTQAAHGLVTNDSVNVTVTSDAAAIVVGLKTVTVVNASTYTFTCLNAGAASGTVTANHIDNYLINGGYLTIDTHTRYGLGSNLSAAIGNMVLSASLGGTVEINSTLVRLIPFNTGTGNVPALDTTISQGSASGKLLGVYSAINVAPTTAGSAMPASGFILIRQWNLISFAAGALTGISASATSQDVAGWLEIVGVDNGTATVNRLNTFKIRGDYFNFLDVTTSGSRATTYQLPTNGGTVVYCPGVEVETGVGTNIYEFYPCAGSRTALLANIGTEELRGRWCWISTAGLVRFGSDGTNSTGGFCPEAGRKIRVANVFLTTCTQIAPLVNVLPNATLTTRYEFATTGSGVIDIDKASINWYLNLNQPFSVALSNTGTMTALVLTECASSIAWQNVGVGQEAANSQTPITMSLNFAGGTMDKCTWTRAAQAGAGNFISSWSDCVGFTITNERNKSLTKAASTGGSITLTRVKNSTWTDTLLGGGRTAQATCSNVKFVNSIYYDTPASTTSSGTAQYAFDIGSACTNSIFDGLSWGGLRLVQPYNGILQITAAGCSGTKLRNLGTSASPLDMGDVQVNDSAWSRATTTATVTTSAAHNLKVGDIIYAKISSDVAAIVVGAKTIATAPTSTTFTFTCLNAGATSGTLTYYPVMAGTLLVISAGAAAQDVKVQRCYTPRLRTGLRSADNSSKDIFFESVYGSDWAALAVPELNATNRGLIATPSLAAQTACYGSHFIDYFTTETPANLAAVAWARVTTLATITSANHGLRTGDLINVTVSSSTGAIVLGQKTITATTSNAFTFTCLNAGAASGTLSFVVLNGRVSVLMNEPSSGTIAQVTLANGAAFTAAGGLYMPTVSHQADFISPVNLIGHSSFPIAEAIMAGGTIGNYTVTFSLDNGVTYGNLYYQRAGGGGSISSTTVTMTSTTGVQVNDYVWGTNVAPNAKVLSIDSATNITVDIANVGAVSGVLRFNNLPSRTVTDASIGFPLRLRIVTVTANATPITAITLCTSSTAASRAFQYPLDSNTVTFSGLPVGCDAFTLVAGGTTLLDQKDSLAGSSYSYTYSGAQTVDVGLFKTGYVPYYIRNLSLGTTDTTIPVSLTPDRNFQ